MTVFSSLRHRLAQRRLSASKVPMERVSMRHNSGDHREGPRLAAQVMWMGALFTLLSVQVMPGVMSLTAAGVAEAQTKKQQIPAPEWAKARIGKGPQGVNPKNIPASQKLSCVGEGCSVDMRALDLSRPPTEKELRRAGQLGGALSPIGEADPDKIAVKEDKELKAMGLANGLATPENVTSATGREVKRRKDKVRRAKQMNLDFGKAMQQWNKHRFRKAAKMFKKYLQDYPPTPATATTPADPGTPWAGEAELHLGCDAKYNGQFAEAENVFSTLASSTSDSPADPSFDINQKAKARWADLDIALGRLDSASEKLKNLLQTDTDWRRRTWEQSWLLTIDLYKNNARDLRACGPQALAVVLNDIGDKAAAKQVGAIKGAPRAAGYSLAEVGALSKKEGVPMTGFSASSVEALETIPTPFIVHYDFHRSGTSAVSFDAHGRKAPIVNSQKESTQFKIGYHLGLPTKVSRAAAHKSNPFKVVSGAPGHFLVVRQVNKATKTVTLYDPIVQRIYHISYQALSHEWSGKGLVIASKIKANAPKVAQATMVEDKNPVRVAWLSMDEMKRVFGGCCGHYSAGPGEGCDDANQGCNGDCGDGPSGGAGGGSFKGRPGGPSVMSMGSPVLSVNRYSLNVYVVDTPLWYKPAMGPSVDLKLSYNSQDSLSQSNPFGNKWMFSYGSYITEDTGAGTGPGYDEFGDEGSVPSGGTVTIFMPDGKKKSYTANGQGGFTPPAGDHSILTKTGDSHYEVQYEGGDTAIFDIPNGTTSLQPFLIEMRDRWGKSLRIGYNQNVKPVTLTDALGQVTTLRYDANDHVTSVWDPFGRSAKFTYDANNNLVQCVDMEGNAFQYVYDYNGNVQQLLTAQGAWTISNVYGNYWTGLQVTDPAGHNETWGYSGYANYSYSDKRGVSVGYKVGYVYGGQPQITNTSNPDNTNSGKSIDSATGLPYAITDARGHSTQVAYNAMSQPTAVTEPKGNTTRMGYAANGVDMTSISNSVGATVVTFTYDSFHKPITAIDANGQTTRYTYTNWGVPASVTSGQGQVTTFNYNARYLLANIVRDGVTMGSFTYDDIGRVQTRTDMRGHTFAYEYNNLDRVTKITFDDGTYITYDYVCCGLVGVTRDRAGRLSYTDYDALKRLTRTQDAMGYSLTYTYDNNGNLTKLVDASGNTTRWGYDNSNRVTAKAYADGNHEAWAYPVQTDYNGNAVALGIVEHTNSRGETSSMIYDDNNNLAKIDYADPNTPDVSLTYNELNKPTGMQDALGVTNFAYDNLGRLTGINGPWDNDGISYTYNAQGQRQTLSVGKGATTGSDTTGYGYDALGRLGQISNGGQSWGYGYEGVTGMIKQLNLPDGEKSVYSYDAFDRLTQLANVRTDGSNVSTYSYGYDEGNPNSTHRPNRVGVTTQIGVEAPTTTSWGYDSTDQLTSESLNFMDENGAAETQNRSYTYDAMGNRTGSTKTEVKSTGTTSATTNYSSNGLNQTTATLLTAGQDVFSSDLAYDTEGNMTQIHSVAGDSRYAYDEANRLISVTSLGANNAPQSKTTFVYDGLSRRRITREFVWQNNAWVQGSEKRSLYDGMNVVQERDGANAVKVSYVRGTDMGGGIGGLLARSDGDGRAFYHYDGRGNVTQLTNAVGVAVVRYLYDAFGNTVEARGGALATANVFRFSTKEVVVGLYDYGLRFYSPGAGRWINRDPIRENGGMNIYGFVRNNPLTHIDPNGLSCESALLNFIAAVAAVVAATVGAIALGAALEAGTVGAATPWLIAGAIAGAVSALAWLAAAYLDVRDQCGGPQPCAACEAEKQRAEEEIEKGKKERNELEKRIEELERGSRAAS